MWLPRQELIKSTGEVSAALFRKGLLQYRFADAARVRGPVLVIAGGRDFQAAIEPQRDLVQALPNALLVEYRAKARTANALKTFVTAFRIRGRPIIDRTELTGGFDFDLKWPSDRLLGPIDPARTSFVTVLLEQQLALTLRPTRAPIDFLVIERIERPTEN